jgi:protein-tyrosine phosphatase
VQIFALLADETTYPAVFHCTTGKDRTGLVAALVLGALGVSDDDIVRDYAMSGANMDAWIEHRRKIGTLPADGSFPSDLPRTFFDTPPEVMESTVGAIRHEHGSVRQCLVAHGVAPSALSGLEHALLGAG